MQHKEAYHQVYEKEKYGIQKHCENRKQEAKKGQMRRAKYFAKFIKNLLQGFDVKGGCDEEKVNLQLRAHGKFLSCGRIRTY